MKREEIDQYIMDMPDDVLSKFKFSMPWQYDASSETGTRKDEDGFPISLGPDKEDPQLTREYLQKQCWLKFQRNPQVNTAITGKIGRLTGWGYETTSRVQEIQEEIENTELDPRNRLYSYWSKYVGRALIEGELFLCLTCHLDGFIEIDFIDPVLIGKDGKDNTGIIYHPTKVTMPLFYNVNDERGNLISQIPSIYIARYPELATLPTTKTNYRDHNDCRGYNISLQQDSRSRKKRYSSLGGYFRFVISWDKGLITRRSISYLRTVLEWLNHYENLKKYEIDHKKAAGSYLWVFSFDNPRDFKLWLTLSDEERAKTAIFQKKTPGGTLVLPPGMTVEAKNPNLTSIKEQDTDLLQMVISGLNEPADVTTGTSKGTFASVKASRGPMSDRVSDEIAEFDRFQKYDFWGSIFFLKNKLNGFPEFFKIKEAVDFDDNQEPIFKKVKKRPEQLIDISYPVSETINFEGRAKGLLGVKHGPVTESVGIPSSEISKRLGIGGYARMRLRKATEDEMYPELIYEQGVDAESMQEAIEGEPGKKKTKKIKKETKGGLSEWRDF